jgi:hypothetical protein
MGSGVQVEGAVFASKLGGIIHRIAVSERKANINSEQFGSLAYTPSENPDPSTSLGMTIPTYRPAPLFAFLGSSCGCGTRVGNHVDSVYLEVLFGSLSLLAFFLGFGFLGSGIFFLADGRAR